MTDDEKSIHAACEAFGTAMQAMDIAGIEALWAVDDEHLVYQPEEHAHPCRTWAEVVEYLQYIPGVVETIEEWRTIDRDVAVLGDAAVVYALLSTSFKLKDVDEPLAGEVRFTFALRRRSDGWRFFHCHESRQLVVEDVAAG